MKHLKWSSSVFFPYTCRISLLNNSLKLRLQKLEQAAESSTELLVSDGSVFPKGNWSTGETGTKCDANVPSSVYKLLWQSSLLITVHYPWDRELRQWHRLSQSPHAPGMKPGFVFHQTMPWQKLSDQRRKQMNNKYLKRNGIERPRWRSDKKVYFNWKVKFPLTKPYFFVRFNGM